MRKVSLKEILHLKENCNIKHLHKLFGKFKGITLDEFINADVSDIDKVLGFSRLNFADDHDKRMFACLCAQSVLFVFEKENWCDKRPRRAIDMALKYAGGESVESSLSTMREAAVKAADWMQGKYMPAFYAANSCACTLAEKAEDAAFLAGTCAELALSKYINDMARHIISYDYYTASSAGNTALTEAYSKSVEIATVEAKCAARVKQVSWIKYFVKTGRWPNVNIDIVIEELEKHVNDIKVSLSEIADNPDIKLHYTDDVMICLEYDLFKANMALSEARKLQDPEVIPVAASCDVYTTEARWIRHLSKTALESENKKNK